MEKTREDKLAELRAKREELIVYKEIQELEKSQENDMDRI